MLKNLARNSQFDFANIKLRKFEFPHQQTTWMMLTYVGWIFHLAYSINLI